MNRFERLILTISPETGQSDSTARKLRKLKEIDELRAKRAAAKDIYDFIDSSETPLDDALLLLNNKGK